MSCPIPNHSQPAAQSHTHEVLHLQNASSLDAQHVLVYADCHLVLQDAAGLAADGPQVIGHEKRSSHDRPQGHLSARLVNAEAKVSNDQLLRAILHHQRERKVILFFVER